MEEGKTTVLECLASGSPKPKLEWFKDEEALALTDRHFFTADNQLLIIVQTKISDAGRYESSVTRVSGLMQTRVVCAQKTGTTFVRRRKTILSF